MTIFQQLFLCIPPSLAAVWLLLSYRKMKGKNAARIAILSIILSAIGLFLPRLGYPTAPFLIDATSADLSRTFIALILGSGIIALLVALNNEKYQTRSSNYYAFLLFFILSMILTVSFSDFRFFFISWELMLFVSSLLIAYWGKGKKRRRVARRYFIISQAASLGILLGIIIIGTNTGQWSLQTASLAELEPTTRNWAVGLLLIGFFTKLAVFPLHFWQPDTYTTATMPVTILLASCMLPLGAYGIYRFIFGLSTFDLTSSYQWILLSMGFLTKIFGAVVAALKKNMKRIIAYSSISQVGFFLVAFGLNSQAGLSITLLHIIIHAPVKALLFICSGEIYHRTQTYNIKKIHLTFNENKWLLLTYLFAAAALIGVPPLSGFYSEFYLSLNAVQTGHSAIAILALLSSLLTVVYLVRIPGTILTAPAKKTPRAMQNSTHQKFTPAVILSLLAIGLQSIFSSSIFTWINSIWKGG